jgi:hypothetical protein
MLSHDHFPISSNVLASTHLICRLASLKGLVQNLLTTQPSFLLLHVHNSWIHNIYTQFFLLFSSLPSSLPPIPPQFECQLMDQEERYTNNSCPTSTQQSRLSSFMQPRYSMRPLDVTSCTTYPNWKLSEENHFTICKQKLLNLLGKGFQIRKKMGTKAPEALIMTGHGGCTYRCLRILSI